MATYATKTTFCWHFNFLENSPTSVLEVRFQKDQSKNIAANYDTAYLYQITRIGETRMSEAGVAFALFYTMTMISGMTLFILGFKLFQNGISQGALTGQASIQPGGATPTDLSGSASLSLPTKGQVAVNLANVAPGTAYAMMGTLLVGIGLFKGPPDIKELVNKQSEAKVKESEHQSEKASKELKTAQVKLDTAVAELPIGNSLSKSLAMAIMGKDSGEKPLIIPGTGSGFGSSNTLGSFTTSSKPASSMTLPIEEQIKTLESQKDENHKRLSELTALKKSVDLLVETKGLTKEEQEMLREWLLNHRLPSSKIKTPNQS